MRRALAPLRVAALLAHIVAGLLLTTLAFPWLAQPARNRIVRGWSRVLLALCGVKLRKSGRALDHAIARTGVEPHNAGRLILSNHISWIDVFAILACVPGRFVAKSEIGRWPLVGWLVTLVGTLYIERGRRHAVAAINHKVRDKLKAGETVAVFPEGTTTAGDRLLAFHSNLIAPAIEVGGEVWPVALRYTERGAPSAATAFVGDMALVNSLWNTLLARGLEVEVAFLPPLSAREFGNRHRIAAAARDAIAQHLDVPLADARATFSALSPVTQRADPSPAGSRPERSGAGASSSQ
ncbi:MAG: lysophospholipid acyltransferase family protein [Pseudomonadota bacterium]